MHALGPPVPAKDRHDGTKFWTVPRVNHNIVS